MFGFGSHAQYSYAEFPLNVSYTLTGVAGTGTAGVIIAKVSVTFTGVAGVGVAGAFGPLSVTTALPGASGTGTAGTITPSVSVALPRAVGTGVVGTLAITTGPSMVPVPGVAGIGVTNWRARYNQTVFVDLLHFDAYPVDSAAADMVSVRVTLPSAVGGGVAGQIRPVLSGGHGHHKKKHGGLEPVIKRHRKPEKPEPPKVWTPPAEYVRAPPIVPRLPAPDIVDPRIVPTGLLGIIDQMQTAEDISDINRFLAQLEQDEQDARDIADVLALLD